MSLLSSLLAAHTVHAQGNQLGAQDRADAAERMVVLAVQHAELRRFTGSRGVLFTGSNFSLDLGVRGAVCGPNRMDATCRFRGR